ncbi:hypothetical protein JCM9279_005332 [Rhodotorula babjevae]
MASRTGSPALHTSRKQQPSTGGANSARSSPKPAGTPPPPAAAPPQQQQQQALPDLDQLLNLPIRVKVAAAGPGVPAREVEGSLFAVDSSFIVLASAPAGSSAGVGAAAGGAGGAGAAAGAAASASPAPKRTYHLLKTSTLESVVVLSRTADPSLPPPSTPLSFAHLPRTPADLSHAVSRALAAQARVAPAGVSGDAQQLFDALARTLPVRWAGESIVVLDEVVVEKPYGVANVKGAKGSAERVERVRKMLEGIRNRLGLTTPQPAA